MRPFHYILLALLALLSFAVARQSLPFAKLDLGRSVESAKQSVQHTDHWRQRFLAIEREPSGALRRSMYYQFALDIPEKEFPAAMEAIYPEGWTFMRGDLPLSITIEWIRRDHSTMASWIERFVRKHPDRLENVVALVDDLENLDDPRVIDVLADLSESPAKNRIVANFLDSLESNSLAHYMVAAVRLKGAQAAFRNVPMERNAEAATLFWENRDRFIDDGIESLDEDVSFAIGKRAGLDAIRELPESFRNRPLLVGILAGNPEAARVLGDEFSRPSDDPFVYISLEEEDARALVAAAIANPGILDPLLKIGDFNNGLDRNNLHALLASDSLTTSERVALLREGARFIASTDFIALTSTLSPKNQAEVFSSIDNPTTKAELHAWIAELNRVPNSSLYAPAFLQASINLDDFDTARSLIETTNAPDYNLWNSTLHTLWEKAPELYLQLISKQNDTANLTQLYYLSNEIDQTELDQLVAHWKTTKPGADALHTLEYAFASQGKTPIALDTPSTVHIGKQEKDAFFRRAAGTIVGIENLDTPQAQVLHEENPELFFQFVEATLDRYGPGTAKLISSPLWTDEQRLLLYKRSLPSILK